MTWFQFVMTLEGLGALYIISLIFGARDAQAAEPNYNSVNLNTGDSNMDRPEILGNIQSSAAKYGLDPQVIMGLCYSESGGHTTGASDGGDGSTYVSDQSSIYGPSYGPMMCNSSTLKEMGFTDDPSTLGQVGNEALAIDWGCQIFKKKLDLALGDYKDAIWRYKGRSPKGYGEMQTTVADIRKFYGNTTSVG